MSTTVGSLVVKLSAHIAEFTSGLQKAGNSTRNFAKESASAFSTSDFLAYGNATNSGLKELSRGMSHAHRHAAKSVPPITQQVQDLRKALLALGKLEFGAMTGPLGRITSALGGMSASVIALGAGVAVFAALTKAAASLWPELKRDREEALKLGITYEQLKKRKDEIPLTRQQQQGAELGGKAWGFWPSVAASITGGLQGVVNELTGVGFHAQVSFARAKEETAAWAKELERAAEVGAKVADIASDWSKRMRPQKPENDLLDWIEQVNKELPKLGVSQAAIDKLIQTGTQQFRDKTRRDEMTKTLEKMKELAEAGRKLAETPLDTFSDKMKQLYAALREESIDPSQFDAARKEVQKSTVADLMKGLGSPGAASAMLAGSRELANAIADRNARNPLLDEAKRQTRVLESIEKKVALEVGEIK